MSALIDLRGKRFTRLLVVAKCPPGPATKWVCACDCGATTVVRSHQLKTGRIKSCGCLRDEKLPTLRLRHGQSRQGGETRAHVAWRSMTRRCLAPESNGFENYGGRGIMVCERWKSFENFYQDMGDPPPGFSIDRIDVNGNYEPGNCRWADRATQNRNTRRTVLIAHQGKSQCMKDWAKEVGISYSTIRRRITKGLSTSEVLSK